MRRRYDIVVVGAGAAGMAAAATVAEAGGDISVLVLDEQPSPGGQIYRAIERPGVGPDVLGTEYADGAALVQALRDGGADYRPGAAVWQVMPGAEAEELEVGVSVDGRAHLVAAGAVIVATGAVERPMPVPGWTLPGVMTVGAAQTLLKGSGLAAEGAVFAGSGPLLFLAVAQVLRAGVAVRAVLETTPRGNFLRAASHLPRAWLAGDHIRRGLKYLREIRRAGVDHVTGVTALAIEGDGRAERIVYRAGGRRGTIAAEHVFLHQGVVPDVNLTRAAGLDHAWHPRQQCWRVVVDDWGAGSVPGVYAAGDGADIAGAVAAECRGRLAALAALTRLGRIDAAARDAGAGAPRQRLVKEMAVRPFLDVLYAPAEPFLAPADEVVVCRCEEVTAGRVRETVALGCVGPNQLKSFCRAGMGPCQGRQCALTVTGLIARATGRPPDAVGDYRRRPPVKPLRLAELAALDTETGYRED